MENQSAQIKQLQQQVRTLKEELEKKNGSTKLSSLIDDDTLKQMNDFNDIADENLSYCVVDKNLSVKSVSKAFTEIFGYNMTTLGGKNFNLLVSAEFSEKFYNGCEYVKNHDKESWGTELNLTTIDDKDIFTKTIINPLFKNDELAGFIFVIHDISSKRLLHQLQVKMMAQEKYHESTFDFISSTSAAVLDTVSYKISTVVKIVVSFIFLFIIYAISFDIDEISRGEGQFIPTSKVQHLKNLEGGVVSTIYVREGDSVKKGQVLVKLNPISYQSKLDENNIRLQELNVKAARLKAESQGLPMEEILCEENCDQSFIDIEKSYYLSNQKELSRNISKQLQQLKYQQSALVDAKYKYSVLEENYILLSEEFQTKKKLEKQKIFTKYELRTLERELNDASSALSSAKEVIVQTKAQISEIQNGIEETKLTFRNKAASIYNETVAEILRIKETKKNLEDIIKRTVVRSPVDGIVKELFVHTVGSSIEPSSDIVTIVPDNYEMVAEVKMKPEEIAKLHIGQDVKLKVTAFDYSIYGDLEGKITNISPDTITDKDTGESHYLIYVKTKKNYLNNNEKYKIKVGMMVNADVLVGKKSIMSFLLKPILKTTQRE
jgi:adhesin transport system membrane fusion protein